MAEQQGESRWRFTGKQRIWLISLGGVVIAGLITAIFVYTQARATAAKQAVEQAQAAELARVASPVVEEPDPTLVDLRKARQDQWRAKKAKADEEAKATQAAAAAEAAEAARAAEAAQNGQAAGGASKSGTKPAWRPNQNNGGATGGGTPGRPAPAEPTDPYANLPKCPRLVKCEQRPDGSNWCLWTDGVWRQTGQGGFPCRN